MCSQDLPGISERRVLSPSNIASTMAEIIVLTMEKEIQHPVGLEKGGQCRRVFGLTSELLECDRRYKLNSIGFVTFLVGF